MLFVVQDDVFFIFLPGISVSCPSVQLTGPSYCPLLPNGGCEPLYKEPVTTTPQPGICPSLSEENIWRLKLIALH